MVTSSCSADCKAQDDIMMLDIPTDRSPNTEFRNLLICSKESATHSELFLYLRSKAGIHRIRNAHTLRKGRRQAAISAMEVETAEEIPSYTAEELRAKAKGKATGKAPITNVCIRCRRMMHSFDIMLAHCGHEYCRGCIAEVFERAITDMSLFPPTCCQREIELNLAYQFLNTDLSGRFAKKDEEIRRSITSLPSQPGSDSMFWTEPGELEEEPV